MELPKEFEAIELDAPEGDIKWYGKEQQTDNIDLNPTNTGEKVIIRLEEFKLNPTLKKEPTKEQLLTPEYLRVVDARLWGDGLRRVMEPRVHVGNGLARIFIPCVAAAGQTILEEPQML